MSIRENIIIWPAAPKEEPVEIQIDQHTYMTEEPVTARSSAEDRKPPDGDAVSGREPCSPRRPPSSLEQGSGQNQKARRTRKKNTEEVRT